MSRIANGGFPAGIRRMTAFYQIGEVCHRTGVTQRALHYYDEIGLLVPTERLNGGQRLYSAADLERIERIKSLKQLLGLSLSEIKRLLDADEARSRFMTAAKSTRDPTRRRRALEEAVRVTEAQLGFVREKGRQLGRLQRQLAGQVRELRRLLSASRAAYIPEKLAGRT
jgi:MerR family transcriptional regulator, repressor of the yfmOP operon